MTTLERSIVNIYTMVPMATNQATREMYIRRLVTLMERRRERLTVAAASAR